MQEPRVVCFFCGHNTRIINGVHLCNWCDAEQEKFLEWFPKQIFRQNEPGEFENRMDYGSEEAWKDVGSSYVAWLWGMHYGIEYLYV